MHSSRNDTMKTTLVGIVGTATSITLERYNLMAAAAAATLTALYMLFKCLDWIINKRKKTTTNPN